jgi:hypothetical protein
MRREPLIDVPPWARPVIVVAMAIPILVALVTAGPYFGLLVASLAVGAVAVAAIRLATHPRGRHNRSADVRREPVSTAGQERDGPSSPPTHKAQPDHNRGERRSDLRVRAEGRP